MHIDTAIAFSGDGAAHVVTDPERAMTFPFALPQGGQGIDGFSTLANGKD